MTPTDNTQLALAGTIARLTSLLLWLVSLVPKYERRSEELDHTLEDTLDDVETLAIRIRDLFRRSPEKLRRRADDLVTRGNELLADDNPKNDARGKARIAHAHDLYALAAERERE